MSTLSSTLVSFSVSTFLQSSNALAPAPIPAALAYAHTIASGTGPDKADGVYIAQATLASGADLDLDLSASLTDLFGAAFSPVKVGLIAIVNGSSTAGEFLHVGNGTNPAFAGLFGAPAHTVKVGPGGALMWSSPVDGLTVTNTTADVLRIHNGGASSQAFSIILVGRSA